VPDYDRDMSPDAGSSLAPRPDVAQAALYDASPLRRYRRNAVFFAAFLVLATVLPLIALFGSVSAEWGLALGRARIVSAVVTGSAPALPGHTCSMTNIEVSWPAPAGGHPGQFAVCDNDVSEFPPGRVVSVAVVAGDTTVTHGESRASAIAGVAIESAVGLLILLMVAATVRWWYVSAAAGKRWKTAPWLAGEVRPGVRSRSGRGEPVIVFLAGPVPWPPVKVRRGLCLVRSFPLATARQAEEQGLDPGNAIDLAIQRRKDGARLASGDRVWVAPTGRTLRRRLRYGPYAVIRATDRRVFWATGLPMPGRGW
jgi:hypothetical protein